MKSSALYKDPNVSVVVLGNKKDFLTKNCSINSYGKNSFFNRFYELNGQICNIIWTQHQLYPSFERKLCKI